MNDLNPLKASRVAGFWYLALAVFGGFGIAWADAHFLVAGNAAATAALVRSEDLFFRLGIYSNLIGQACFVMVGLGFYRLFKPVNANQARILAALVIAAVPIAFLNMVFKFGALLLVDPSMFAAIPVAEKDALVLWLLEVQKYGTQIASVFWGLWLLPLGVLTWQSGWFPKVLGVLLLVNGAAYVLDSALVMTLPTVHSAAGPVLAALLPIGEIPFLLWVLIRGARVKATA